ncbi:MAG: glycoside hydrolase family 88 protein [Defluviitaleaceae bacterium]|nr:glycoside hydrolase family 88 protein [Defluviitaleaceae bacterium]
MFTTNQKTWAEEMYAVINKKLEATCARAAGKLPFYPEKDGFYKDNPTNGGLHWWTNGFWPGMLWQAYNSTGNENFRTRAEEVEERFDDLFNTFSNLHHDVGFMWLHTSAANYRLTGNARSRVRTLHAANLLAGRYNPLGKFIRAWNAGPPGRTIVDTMMNLPILYFASKELNDPRFEAIARNHADTVARVTVRADGSCNHISDLDPVTGDILETPAGQGYASGSSWTRGNAWALYGFALSYLHTSDLRYLGISKSIAHYFIANLALSDWITHADFRSPKKPVKYDSSAAMIAACGMLEIAKHVDEHEKSLYISAAMNTLNACSDKFLCKDTEKDGIMFGASSLYHAQESSLETDTSLIYGDYFFTEAVLRILGKDFLIW